MIAVQQRAPAVPFANLPRDTAAAHYRRASASGVFEEASAGSVPSATTCASVVISVTMTMVMMRANGTSRRGLRVSPAITGMTS